MAARTEIIEPIRNLEFVEIWSRLQSWDLPLPKVEIIMTSLPINDGIPLLGLKEQSTTMEDEELA